LCCPGAPSRRSRGRPQKLPPCAASRYRNRFGSDSALLYAPHGAVNSSSMISSCIPAPGLRSRRRPHDAPRHKDDEEVEKERLDRAKPLWTVPLGVPAELVVPTWLECVSRFRGCSSLALIKSAAASSSVGPLANSKTLRTKNRVGRPHFCRLALHLYFDSPSISRRRVRSPPSFKATHSPLAVWATTCATSPYSVRPSPRSGRTADLPQGGHGPP
jgi:hypothetical protein